ncbi:MAG: transglycosylase SLT domain-containing protein [Gemmatimonadales bacterium]
MRKCLLPILLVMTIFVGCDDGGPTDHLTARPPDRQPSSRPPPARLHLPPELIPASEALDQGMAWRATLELAPILADHTRRSDEAVLLAARAAGAWGGWDEVTDLLNEHEFTDDTYRSEVRDLLVKAQMAKGELEQALDLARSAVADTTLSPEARADALARLGLIHQALGQNYSAAAAFATARPEWGSAGDWLLLRAATLTADSLERHQLFDEITHPVARDRIALTDARAILRFGDSTHAAMAYRAAGWPATGWAIELALATDSSDSAMVRQGLLDFVRDEPEHPELSLAIELVTKAFRPLAPEDELGLARSAYRRNFYPAAQAAYRRALDADIGNDADWFHYGKSLVALRFFRPATRAYARVKQPASLAAQARYEEAMARLRGRIGGTRKRLQSLEQDYPLEPAAMAATLLLADLSSDGGQDREARAQLRRGAARSPDVPLAPLALYRAALIGLGFGDMQTAASELDTIVFRYPQSDLLPGVLYWSGRSWARLGDTAAARTRWLASLGLDSTGYYADLARRRLSQPPAPISPGRAPMVRPDIDSALARVERLREVGFREEGRLEELALIRQAGDTVDRLLETATVFKNHGYAAQALRLADRALWYGATRDQTLLRLLYPVLREEALVRLAAERDIDPALVAGIIRQESNFDPSATSRAGARGLMQIMPGTGSQIARRERYPLWDPVLLYEPDVSLEMGTSHLAGLLRRSDHVNYVLAAYNAGGGRVRRWRRRAGTEDPELFVERIPFRETRGYVKKVQTNRGVYASLYGWEPVASSQ